MKNDQNQVFGAKGEQLAQEYLQTKGFVLIHKNWRGGRGEFDLVMKDKEHLVFVEVKTRDTYFFGDPEGCIGREKIQKMQSTAAYYLAKYPISKQMDIRFDIVSVVIRNKHVDLFHIEDAFW